MMLALAVIAASLSGGLFLGRLLWWHATRPPPGFPVCTRPPPHRCAHDEPCNGWPRFGFPARARGAAHDPDFNDSSPLIEWSELARRLPMTPPAAGLVTGYPIVLRDLPGAPPEMCAMVFGPAPEDTR